MIVFGGEIFIVKLIISPLIYKNFLHKTDHIFYCETGYFNVNFKKSSTKSIPPYYTNYKRDGTII